MQTELKPDHLYRWAKRELPNSGGRIGWLCQMVFTWRLCIGFEDDEFGYDDGWCYEDFGRALTALSEWDGSGEPQGWHRHPGTGRRRPDGDPAREYVHR